MAETLLVVDDEDVVREVLAEILTAAGYAVVTARHGLEALEQLDRHRVDLVVSDISMPVLDGYGLHERLRARPDAAALPFLFLSAHGEPHRLRQAREMGVDDYLVKPAASEDLLAAVRGLLVRRSRLDAARDAQIGAVKEAILLAVAHELRTPLTYLAGYAELLATSSDTESARLRTMVEGVQRGTRRLQRLAEDLVFLVELRSGEVFRRFEREKRPVAGLERLLRGTLTERRDQARAAGVTLVEDVDDDLPAVVGDDRLLREAVDRLLDNAIKFSRPGGGSVTLAARAAGSEVAIEVVDHGVGIAADELARIVELFHQVDRQRNEQQGVGCGLTVARSIAQVHGGRLEASSEFGVGSRFVLRLPAAD